ncbi:MAG: PD40 domain-containing protein [Candidatus Eisenbacteria bacterium]|nr:PD40 domain-containing protein [Candidatus Eisenbacteria bacterium]
MKSACKQTQLRCRGTAALIGTLLGLFGCGDDHATVSLPPDVTPPGRVTDLAVRELSPGRVRLDWTSPGDDGSDGTAARYDLRRAIQEITDQGWEAAIPISPLPKPQVAGRLETLQVDSLAAERWHFALRAVDEAGNPSALSNSPAIAITDQASPAPVVDLAVVAVEARALTLTWTATGDDGHDGTAAAYELRVGQTAIGDSTWSEARSVAGVPPPRGAGAIETFRVSGLTPDTTYVFAIRVIDEQGNASPRSVPAWGATDQAIETRLTTSIRIAGAEGPDWSPDGEFLLFHADWSAAYRASLHLLRVKDLTESAISPPGIGGQFGRWSPDGTRIAYAAPYPTNQGELQELALRSPDGSQQPTTLYRPKDGRVRTCAWSPSGSELACVVNTGSWPFLRTSIHVVPVAGGPATVLHSRQDEVRWIDWSPDGTRIAFNSDRVDDHEIWSIDRTTGRETRITTSPGFDLTPRYSPDGARLAFSSNRSGNYEIWLSAADGTDPEQITHSPEYEIGPAWSPDGRRLAFARYDRDQLVYDLWLTEL